MPSLRKSPQLRPQDKARFQCQPKGQVLTERPPLSEIRSQPVRQGLFVEVGLERPRSPKKGDASIPEDPRKIPNLVSQGPTLRDKGTPPAS